MAKDPARLKPLPGLNISGQYDQFAMRIGATGLECIPQTELVLSIRRISRAFARHFSKRAAGWVHVRIVPVGVVEEVKGFCPEDEFMILMVRDEMEALLERGIEALEAGAIDNVSRLARRESANSCGLKHTRFKPLRTRAGAKFVRQPRCARMHVVLIARSRSDPGLVEVTRDSS